MAHLHVISAGFVKRFLRQEVQNAAPQNIKEVGLRNFGISTEKNPPHLLPIGPDLPAFTKGSCFFSLSRLEFCLNSKAWAISSACPIQKIEVVLPYHFQFLREWGFYALAMFYTAMLFGIQASSYVATGTIQIFQTKFEELPCVSAWLLPTHSCDTHTHTDGRKVWVLRFVPHINFTKPENHIIPKLTWDKKSFWQLLTQCRLCEMCFDGWLRWHFSQRVGLGLDDDDDDDDDDHDDDDDDDDDAQYHPEKYTKFRGYSSSVIFTAHWFWYSLLMSCEHNDCLICRMNVDEWNRRDIILQWCQFIRMLNISEFLCKPAQHVVQVAPQIIDWLGGTLVLDLASFSIFLALLDVEFMDLL